MCNVEEGFIFCSCQNEGVLNEGDAELGGYKWELKEMINSGSHLRGIAFGPATDIGEGLTAETILEPSLKIA